jgi:hypothetical protein
VGAKEDDHEDGDVLEEDEEKDFCDSAIPL